MEKQLNDSQLEEVSAGRLYAGFVSPGEDTGFRDALLRRKIKVEDREWELKIWQAYQDNARQWTGQVLDVVNAAVDAGAAFYTGGASAAAKGASAAAKAVK